MTKNKPLVDSHCHLDFKDFDKDLPMVVERAKLAGITKILTICTNSNDLSKTVQIAEKYDIIYFSFGLHPLNVGKGKISKKEISQVAKHEKMVAIGETGLDYHYSEETKSLQKKYFIEHIELAQTLGLPVIIHSRSADQDMKNILEEQYKKNPFSAVMHCFTSGKKLATCALNLGFYLSMSGIITFPNSKELVEIFSNVPLNKILIETDSPYLAPIPFRGKRNEPSLVTNTCKKGAEIFGIDDDMFRKVTTENFMKLFWKVKV